MLSDRHRLQTLLLAAALGYGIYLAATAGGSSGGDCDGGTCPVVVPNKKPTPKPTPIVPSSKVAQVLALSSPGCSWCVKLKQEMPAGGWPVPVVWVDVTTPAGRALAQPYLPIPGTPTLVAVNAAGGEVKRFLGYAPQEELLAWLESSLLSQVRERGDSGHVFP